MAPFKAEDGNEAWHFPADIIDGPGDFVVADGAEVLLVGQPGPFRALVSDLPTPEPVMEAAYERRISRIVEEINAGQVVSRIEPMVAKDVDLIARFEVLMTAYPGAFVVRDSSAVTGTWLVATPEILLHADTEVVRTMALAGTQWPKDPFELSSVVWSEKLIAKQGIVAAEIRRIFESAGLENLVETEARTVRAANLCHLRSDFSAPLPKDMVLAELLRELHPTSAVCGMPRAVAQEFIAQEEGDTRGVLHGLPWALQLCRHHAAVC